MKVVFFEDVQGTGKKYEVKDVSGGYARNFLFPRKLAVPATDSMLKEVEQKKVRAEKEDATVRTHLGEVASHLNESFLEFILKGDEKGSVFGSVTKEMILKAMREHGWIGKERVSVSLEHPLKEPGTHVVPVDLKKGVRGKLNVVIRLQS